MMNLFVKNNPFILLTKSCQLHKKSWKIIRIFSNEYSDEASFTTQEYKLHKLDSGPSTSVSVTKEDALKMYRQMNVVRRMEGAAGNMYREKIVRGFLHLYSGQEAVAVGMIHAMRPQDSSISAYRCHAWTYLTGVSVTGVLAELTGRSSGCARGKGGSMHMYSPTFYGGNGIVGAQIPLGVGIGFAAKYKGTDGVCVALYGDGAANQGQLFEVYNMACLWSLPIIFVCENNLYAMGTSTERHAASHTFYTRGDYLPGLWVDGMDVLASREATRFAIQRCQEGKGPILLEMETYRYSGHSMSDPGTSYRKREEIQEVRQNRDPINLLKGKMLSSGLAAEDELTGLENEAKAEVEEAINNAKNDPELPLQELGTDIYAGPWDQELRGRLPDKPLKHSNTGKPFKPIT